MPVLHLRAVSPELMARLKASARDADEPIDVHALGLLRAGLNVCESARRGGLDRAARMTDEQRRESARKAAAARWTKPQASE